MKKLEKIILVCAIFAIVLWIVVDIMDLYLIHLKKEENELIARVIERNRNK